MKTSKRTALDLDMEAQGLVLLCSGNIPQVKEEGIIERAAKLLYGQISFQRVIDPAYQAEGMSILESLYVPQEQLETAKGLVLRVLR